MNIFLIERTTDTPVYDSNDGHVIVAHNDKEVIGLAKSKASDEGADCWNYADITDLGTYKGSAEKPFIVLTDFHAG